MRVLLVGDYFDYVEEIRNFLVNQGHSVEVATNAKQANKLLDDNELHFDALITDLRIPLGTGLYVISAAHRGQRAIPSLLHSKKHVQNEVSGATLLDGWEYPYAVFHNKKDEDWKKYIPKFLSKIKV